MNFFDEDPLSLPCDGRYYFNVCIINVAIRRSCGGEFEDIWDLKRILEPRPIAYHFYIDEDKTFKDGRKWDIDIYYHCVLEVSDILGVSFFGTDLSNEDENSGEFPEPNDFWRF